MSTVLLRNIPKVSPKNLLLLPRNLFNTSPPSKILPLSALYRCQSTGNSTDPPVTLQQKLKKAVAEYGSTVIVFHVGISLVSLGTCYVLVSSGLDGSQILVSMGISSETGMKVATNAGTFAVAYAVHKVFAPVRIMVTLTATPFVVRYLRHVGFLKKVK